MRILACQIRVPETRTAAERDAHVARLADAARRQLHAVGGADLVLFPELATVEYSRAAFERLDVLAEEADGPSFQAFSTLARECGAAVSYGFPARSGGRFLISQAVIGADGSPLARYDKNHIPQFGDSPEKEYFSPGEGQEVFRLGDWRIGILICYDFRFAATCGRLAGDMGAELLLHPSAFTGDGTFASWHPFVMTRAMENQVYFLSLNRAGGGWGRSVLCPPWVAAEGDMTEFGKGEEFRLLTLNRAVISEARATYPLRTDAR